MDTNFSKDDIAFRDEVRKFFDDEFDSTLAKNLGDGHGDNYKESIIAWQKKLYKKGWIAPNWPKEFGGTGWTDTQKFIYESERGLAGVPDVLPFGLKMVGPVIYTFGTQEQKDRFLPKILSSDHWWCQGYSEPGAGSDLASLTTSADYAGANYLVNGRKIWTSLAQYADWIFCLVRTSKGARKQEGISFLLIDMSSPGITVKPIITIDGRHSLNEVLFENVSVPVENLIGEQDKGWTYAKALLAHERTNMAEVADSKRMLTELKDKASKSMGGGRCLADDQVFQKQVSDVELDLMALEYTELRALASIAEKGMPGPESSLLKIKGTEISQQLHELHLKVAAHHGGAVALTEERYDEIQVGSDARNRYLYGRAATIYGGSNEVQRNVIAKAVLGL
jgi:alkylation response protein AidB-like acyl-CoA dehydrogenase|tara:strand:- start:893 stop:2074 length:1182 start_codon:yes stop_codon:yes gene_type:complete